MTYTEAVQISKEHLLDPISKLYGLKPDARFTLLSSDGGWNVVYACQCDALAAIVKISYAGNRDLADILGETAFVRHLHDKGCSVANVIDSASGRLAEALHHDGHTIYIVLFEKARGKRFVDYGYKYRAGAPITEYYFNCGRTLGKIHQASKEYAPTHPRYSFLDHYTEARIRSVVPASMPVLQDKMIRLLHTLESLPQTRETFGMVHFDYCDGNYHIDMNDGHITVYDFDNACACWYMYDLADLWMNGMGWTARNRDADQRRRFMDEYFKTALEGYKSETNLDGGALRLLPLFIQAANMEGILDAFESAPLSGEDELEDETAYLIKCMVDDIPYRGFFDPIFSCDEPFCYAPDDL